LKAKEAKLLLNLLASPSYVFFRVKKKVFDFKSPRPVLTGRRPGETIYRLKLALINFKPSRRPVRQ